ncbi:hypothetical protein B0H14DRAFT_2999306 [Mycena olivaceomarginata]|nr:hypothetical protein B0H14DRAFT_2999306 [Mycena olivaceomarginata]
MEACCSCACWNEVRACVGRCPVTVHRPMCPTTAASSSLRLRLCVFPRLPLCVIPDHPTSNDDEGGRCAAAAQMGGVCEAGCTPRSSTFACISPTRRAPALILVSDTRRPGSIWRFRISETHSRDMHVVREPAGTRSGAQPARGSKWPLLSA